MAVQRPAVSLAVVAQPQGHWLTDQFAHIGLGGTREQLDRVDEAA